MRQVSSYETDHHHIVYTMLKSCFNNIQPKSSNDRDFKHFSQEAFKRTLKISVICGNSYDDFTSRLSKHTPEKKS